VSGTRSEGHRVRVLTRVLNALDWVAAPVLLVACSASSQIPGAISQIVVPPTITVVDAVTHQAICDATVLVTSFSATYGSGSAAERLSTQDAAPYLSAATGGLPIILRPVPASTPSGICSYDAGSVFGLFAVQVSHSGYRTEDASNLYPQEGDRSNPPTAEVVTIELSPVGP
jgi:hypothetical protein